MSPISPRTLLVARFVHAYPGLYWAPWWPTPDHVIPYPLFYQLVAAMRHLAATEQLREYYAVRMGAAAVWSGPEGQAAVTRAVLELSALAYPEPPSDPKEPAR